MKKIVFFVFNGDPMCFIHVLLNAIDMNEKGSKIKIVIEGSATALLPQLVKEDHPLKHLWEKAKSLQLIDGVCKACAKKTETLAAAEEQNLPILSDMYGHPSMTGYSERGFEIITF